MGLLSMYNMLPELPEDSSTSSGPTNPYTMDPVTIESNFDSWKDEPVYYRNADPYFGDSITSNWCYNSPILKALDDEFRFPAIKQKLDPNKIFNADNSALKTVAADQQKITRIFEKRLIESLTDKGKFGLTEEDIEAMQALTTARSAITNIIKEQITIKKNIADIKLKQEQFNDKMQMQNASSNGNASGGNSMSSSDYGRSFLDSIFDMPQVQSTPAPTPQTYQSLDQNSAGDVLDNLLQSAVDPRIQYESNDPKTYVLVGDTESDVEFVTFGSDGNEIPDYPNPTSHIEKIDRDRGVAVDDLLVEYPLKFKN